MVQLLVDVDALCKLAHWRLLSELPYLLGTVWSDCATLTSAKHRARKAKVKPDGRIFRTTAAAEEALWAIEQMQPTLEPNAEGLKDFENVPGIDPGEAVLLSAIATSPSARLLTGDKRALRALASTPNSIRSSYAGKIILVEQVILGALDAHDLAWLRDHVCPEKDVDKTISMIMGGRCDASEVSVREGLASHLNELKRLCDPSIVCERLSLRP